MVVVIECVLRWTRDNDTVMKYQQVKKCYDIPNNTSLKYRGGWSNGDTIVQRL